MSLFSSFYRRVAPFSAALAVALVVAACSAADEQSGETIEDTSPSDNESDDEDGADESDALAGPDRDPDGDFETQRDGATDDQDDAADDERGASRTVATEAFEVDADGITLEGTTFLPDSDPLGGIVIAHGSGPFSRTGEMPGQLGLMLPEPVEVYTELGEAFADAGYVVVTFDKRTCGPFNGCTDNSYPEPDDDLTFDVLVEDANAVVETIAGRDDVDDVAVVGHSKGGTVAAHLADNDDISAVALLGAPVQPIHDIMRTQAAKLWELSEGSGGQASVMTQVTSLTGMADAIEMVADGEVDGGDIGGVSRQFWASWVDASEHAPGLLDDAEVSALALGGTMDWNVTADEVETWADVVEDVEVVIIEGMAHTLTHIDEEDPDQIDADTLDIHVDEAVTDAVVDFLADTR